MNLTDLNDDTLMTRFAEFTAWQSFAAMQFAEAEVGEAKAEATIRRIAAEGFVLNFDPKAKVTDIKAAIDASPEMLTAREALLTAYARRKLTGVMFANCERSAFVISRELSRRIGASGQERRASRWNP